MPEHDIADRTEEATPRKLREARERGLVAKSSDLSAALILLGAVVVLKLWGHYPLEAVLGFTRGALGNLDAGSLGVGEIYAYLGGGLLFMLRATVPVIAGLLLVALLANIVQTGFLFTGDPLAPNFERLNPFDGVRRMLSRRGVVRLLGALLKLAAVALVACVTVRSQLGLYNGLSEAGVGEVLAFIMKSGLVVGLRVAVALVALAMLDYLYQRWQYRQDMKMTKQEVRDELKRMEGDPLTRDRRQRMQRRIATERMMIDVPRSDVVIAAEGDVAVAVRYAVDTMSAPTVTAKGRGLRARRIREMAEQSAVPVVDRDRLARALDRVSEVGEQVPAHLYEAVAEVLAFVMEVSRMKAAAKPRTA